MACGSIVGGGAGLSLAPACVGFGPDGGSVWCPRCEIWREVA